MSTIPMKTLTVGGDTFEIVDETARGKAGIYYGTCDTSATTVIKLVTCNGFNLVKGAIIGILFTTANTAVTPQLNINSTGAKSTYVGNNLPNSTTNIFQWSANTMIYFMYDGSYFRYITSVAAGSVTPPRGANTWFGVCNTAATASNKVCVVDNYILTTGSLVSINFINANTYTGPLYLNINGTALQIVTFGGTDTSTTVPLYWEAGENLTFMYTGNAYVLVGRSTATNVQIVRW